MRPLAKLFPQEMGRADAGRGRGCLRTRTAWARSAPQAITERGRGDDAPLAAEGRAPGSIKR
ncbi:hypothetical protein DWUX_1885 [Desulfovibrio diazotrophicus]|nr:hypothetical protein DWUX_1885 [Desulfovibrio diazotrophicus]